MRLLGFLFRTCRSMVGFTIATALLSGACNAGLIAIVNLTLNHANSSLRLLAAAFIALTLAKVATNYLSQVLLVRYAQGAACDLRRDLIRKILGVPLRQLEEIGNPALLVALTDDVFNITQALLAFPIITVNVAVLLGGAAYLGWLSWPILLGVSGLIIFGAVSYRLFMHSAFRSLNQAREEEDKLYGHFRALTEGIKELKLHRNRRAVFLAGQVQKTTDDFARHNIAAEHRFVIAQNWNHVLFYLLVGLILFLLPSIKTISTPTMTGYVLTILYLMGPLAGVLSSLSMFSRADVALRRVEKLGLTLATGPREEPHTPPGTDRGFGEAQPQQPRTSSRLRAFLRPRHATLQPIGDPSQNGSVEHSPATTNPGAGTARAASSSAALSGATNPSHAHLHPAAPAALEPFQSLELHRVIHSYHHEKEDANFVLGPITLRLDAGELVFLVGGNGSGKSTLAKIIAGLYFPEGGEIRVNGHPINNHNRDDYRQLFAAVFSDFYVFESLIGLNNPNLDTQAREYLERFHLSHKVSVHQGALSTTSVSQGQRKRLALLTAYLEDRPFYLFDEWASDQDPHFKAIFYTQLLPELKSRGKTILVITHDDKYFHLADRLIKLDYGKLDARPLPDTPPTTPVPVEIEF